MDTSSHNISRLVSFHLRKYRSRIARARSNGQDFSEDQDILDQWRRVLSLGCKWAKLCEQDRAMITLVIEQEAEEYYDD